VVEGDGCPRHRHTEGTTSFALALNDGGQVVGISWLPGDQTYQGFLWTPGVGFQNMGLPLQSQASAINASGQVTGVFFNEQDQLDHAFLWNPGVGMKDLGAPFGGHTFGVGINAAGQVIILSNNPSGSLVHTFLWSENTGPVDLGALENGGGTIAYSWNDQGQLTGISFLPGVTDEHAFLWSSPGPMQDLGILPGGTFSSTRQINTKGEVVGYADGDSQCHCLHSILWTQAHGMEDIVGGFSSVAYGVNNKTLVMGTDDAGYYIWNRQLGVNHLKKVTRPIVGGINDAGQMIAEKAPRHAPKTEMLITPIMHAAVSSSKNPSQVGDSVTFTATVRTLIGAPPDGEMVRLQEGTKLIASSPLTSGVVSFTTSALKAGTHSLKVVYGGDANYDPAKSTILKQVVNP
jgi:probable HAF family extracellular repeat protein